MSQRNAAGSNVFRIMEGNASGAFVQTWMTFNKGAGSALFHAAVERFATTATGAAVTGQITASDAAPVGIDDLTRKDYVDGLVNSLQAEIDDIKNGFAFTGAISAPTVTEV